MAQGDPQIDVVMGHLSAFVNARSRDLILECTAELTEGTPIDTGWARSNWVPSVGEPFRGLAGSKDNVSYAEQAAGIAAVAAYGFFKRLLTTPLFVSNNVPYIRTLNEGWSRQAPPLFVEAAVERAAAVVGSRSPPEVVY